MIFLILKSHVIWHHNIISKYIHIENIEKSMTSYRKQWESMKTKHKSLRHQCVQMRNQDRWMAPIQQSITEQGNPKEKKIMLRSDCVELKPNYKKNKDGTQKLRDFPMVLASGAYRRFRRVAWLCNFICLLT